MEKVRRTLPEIIKNEFVGPVALRCGKRKRNNGETSTCLWPADGNAKEKLLDIFNLEYLPLIFHVGAFFPVDGKTYDCFVRLRPKIIEAIPDNFSNLERTGEWRPEPILSSTDLVFEKGHDRWVAKKPDTGQYIQAFDMVFEPGPDGKAHIPAQTIALRPACTRTFWIAGDLEIIRAVSDHALEIFQETEEEDFSFARQWFLFGKLFTAFEVMGDPTQGLRDLDSFKTNVSHAVGDFKKGMSTLLVVLHPDKIMQRGLDGLALNKALDLAEETRNNIGPCSEWFERWADHFIGEIHRYRASGISISELHAPLPFRQKPRKNFRLIDLSPEELEKMLFRTRKPRVQTKAASGKTTTKKISTPNAEKPAEAVTTEKTEKPRTTGRRRAVKTEEHVDTETVLAATSGKDIPNNIADAIGKETVEKLNGLATTK